MIVPPLVSAIVVYFISPDQITLAIAKIGIQASKDRLQVVGNKPIVEHTYTGDAEDESTLASENQQDIPSTNIQADESMDDQLPKQKRTRTSQLS